MIKILLKPVLIYEDKDFLAVNKPAGLLTQPVRGSDEPALTDWLLKNYPEVKKAGDDPKARPGIVHRLDKDTSGIIIAARNQKFFEYLKGLFQTHQVKKTYLTLVHGRVLSKKGIIDKPIGLKDGSIRRTPYSSKMLKEAVTEYKVLKYFSYNTSPTIVNKVLFSLLEIVPRTGRTHQIRVHLASIGHPVAGDKLYTPRSLKKVREELVGVGLKRQFLHAQSLEFSLEDGKRIHLEADLPRELSDFLKTLSVVLSDNTIVL